MSDGFVQIDASNAFNLINRTLLLHIVKMLCPEIATYINNCYIKPFRLLITGRNEISSNEGTIQGGPIAIGVFALSNFSNNTGNLTHRNHS